MEKFKNIENLELNEKGFIEIGDLRVFASRPLAALALGLERFLENEDEDLREPFESILIERVIALDKRLAELEEGYFSNRRASEEGGTYGNTKTNK